VANAVTGCVYLDSQDDVAHKNTRGQSVRYCILYKKSGGVTDESSVCK